MKIYRSLFAVLLLFIVIYAFRGYINPAEYGADNSVFSFFGKIGSTSLSEISSNGSSSSSTDTSFNVVNSASSTQSKNQSGIEDTLSVAKGSYSPNRDKLPPIIGNNAVNNDDTALSSKGILAGTNSEREKQSLPDLKDNPLLDKSAMIKLKDMFNNQYFEHVSPNGASVSDVVEGTGYTFLVAGENLALGNFGGDPKVVAAWMASPGHRANILDKRYTEIGIAVGYGLYKGQNQWLAVQHFARPMSSCPSPSAGLKTQISKSKDILVTDESDISSMKIVVDRTDSDSTNFKSVIASYNALVNDYNNNLKNLKTEISNYNDQVKNFNSCLDSVTTSAE